MKRVALLLLLSATFIVPLRAQCPPATYTTYMRPLPPNSTVSIVLDNTGAGFSGVEGLKAACAEGENTTYCDACFTGDYRTNFVDVSEIQRAAAVV